MHPKLGPARRLILLVLPPRVRGTLAVELLAGCSVSCEPGMSCQFPMPLRLEPHNWRELFGHVILEIFSQVAVGISGQTLLEGGG